MEIIACSRSVRNGKQSDTSCDSGRPHRVRWWGEYLERNTEWLGLEGSSVHHPLPKHLESPGAGEVGMSPERKILPGQLSQCSATLNRKKLLLVLSGTTYLLVYGHMSALTCSPIFSPVIHGIVVTGFLVFFFFWKLQGSAIWSTKDGFTLENPPSMTVASFLPGKQKAPGLERLCCSSSVYVCFWKAGTCFALLRKKVLLLPLCCSLFGECFQGPT